MTSGWHIAVLRHCLTYRTVTVGCLLHGGNEIAGETLLLVITFIQRVPADIVFACRPLGNERGLSVARRTCDQRQPKLFAPESLASRRSRTTVWSSRTGRLNFDGISIVNHFTVEYEEILFFALRN